MEGSPGKKVRSAQGIAAIGFAGVGKAALKPGEDGDHISRRAFG